MGLFFFACRTVILGLLTLFFTSRGAPIGAHAWSYKQQIVLALVGCLPICQVIYQKRVRGFHKGFQKLQEIDEKVECFNFIVSRCLKPLMKPETRVFEMTSQRKQYKNMQ